MRAVVAGGGLAGLAAAFGLVRAGIETVLLESAPVPGGLAAGFRDRGYAFDLLPGSLGGGDPEVLRLCEAWSGRPLLRSRRSSRILIDGRLLRHPPDVRDLLGTRGLSVALGALAGRLQRHLGGGDEAADYGSFVAARFGAPLVERVFSPIVEKITGLPVSELSSELARDTLPAAGLAAQLAGKLLGRELPWEDVHVPEAGLLEIPEGLVRALRRAGAAVLLSHRVTALRGAPGRIDEVLAEGPRGTVRIRADLVVSSLPVPALLDALPAEAAPDARAAAARLRMRGLLVVDLAVRRDRVTADHDILVPDPAVRFHRLSETVNHAPRMAPRGATGLCAEIACEPGDRVWKEDDAGHVRRVIDDLCSLGFLRSTAEVEAAWVRRLPHALPIPTLEHPALRERIQQSLADLVNLRRCGRQGGLRTAGATERLRDGLDTGAGAASLARHIAEARAGSRAA